MNPKGGEPAFCYLGEMMKIEWPVFWILKPEDQVKLRDFQDKNYGMELTIPPDPFKPVFIDSKPETLEEVDKELRKAPSRSRN